MSSLRIILMVLVVSACDQNPVIHASANSSPVWVAQSDGKKSCAPESAQGLEQGKEILVGAGIAVLDQKKSRDGLAHIQVCGADSGSQNAYLIPKDRVTDARALGFQQVKKK